MFNGKLLYGTIGIVAMLFPPSGMVRAEEKNITSDAITKTIQACVEAARGKDYEIARENALKLGRELLPVVSNDKKDISTIEWVVREALKAWIENPDMGKECYNIVSKCEKGKDILGRPGKWAGFDIREKFGKKALPFLYEILLKCETHPLVLSGIIGQLNTVTLENKESIQVVIELLKIRKVQDGNEEYYEIQGLKGKGKWDEPKGVIWNIVLSAVGHLGSIGIGCDLGEISREIFNETRSLEPLKKLYTDSEKMEPFKNVEHWYFEEPDEDLPDDLTVALRNELKKKIVEAIERIGQKDGIRTLEELGKTEKQEKMIKRLREAKQRIIDKQRDTDKMMEEMEREQNKPKDSPDKSGNDDTDHSGDKPPDKK